jgi:hypothetical protein
VASGYLQTLTVVGTPLVCSGSSFSFMPGNGVVYNNSDTSNSQIAFVATTNTGPTNIYVNGSLQYSLGFEQAGGAYVQPGWTWEITNPIAMPNVIIKCISMPSSGLTSSQSTAVAVILGLYIAAVCLLSMGTDKTIERHVFYLLTGFLMLIAATGLAVAYITIV